MYIAKWETTWKPHLKRINLCHAAWQGISKCLFYRLATKPTLRNRTLTTIAASTKGKTLILVTSMMHLIIFNETKLNAILNSTNGTSILFMNIHTLI